MLWAFTVSYRTRLFAVVYNNLCCEWISCIFVCVIAWRFKYVNTYNMCICMYQQQLQWLFMTLPLIDIGVIVNNRWHWHNSSPWRNLSGIAERKWEKCECRRLWIELSCLECTTSKWDRVDSATDIYKKREEKV